MLPATGRVHRTNRVEERDGERRVRTREREDGLLLLPEVDEKHAGMHSK